MTETREAETDECVEVCNSLLRGELSAIETYEQAIEKFSEEPQIETLKLFLEDHRKSADHLRRTIEGMGAHPAEDSGAWGTFAKVAESVASLFGDSSAVTALKQGEEKGREDYESALVNEAVLPGCKQVIKSTLLPLQEKHIARLTELQASL